LGLRVKFVENFTKIPCPETTGFSVHVQYSVKATSTSNQAWSKGLDALHTVNSNKRTSNCQCSLLKIYIYIRMVRRPN
jgi:hypothetical protein